ncbi:MAG: methyltransferase domain-containing protein [Candidatus Rokubacteria bacterium]|nr:methyltransferase domain-containing protein [Candidatus Rokubacteria bacterium]
MPLPAPATRPTSGTVPLSDKDFELLRRLVRGETGIALGPQKRLMLQARLNRRLRALGLTSFAQYLPRLTDGDHPEEQRAFINAVTTNKTDFFRERHHFAYLAERWAAARQAHALRGGSTRIRAWSAACSTGEEAYTLAMVLSEAGLAGPQWDARILASDINTDALAVAAAGAYPIERAAAVPPPLLTRYFLRRLDESTAVRARRSLRDLIRFRRINLAVWPWPFRSQFDLIFCRNALIYFDRPTQRQLLERLLAVLKPGGLLFLGHSESVFGLVDGLSHLGNTIYLYAGPHALGQVSR